MARISKKTAFKKLNGAKEKTTSILGSAIENAITNGEILLDIKERGNFNFKEMFNDPECPITHAQASKFMRIAIHKNQARLEFKNGTTTINGLQKVLPAATEPPVVEEKQPHADSSGKKHISTGENDWYTPSIYIEAASVVLGGIDLDPATSDLAQSVVQAKTYYTEADNGLTKEWRGSVWMNPPYSMPLIQRFIDKLLKSNIEEWIVLTNNSSDTAWFHNLMYSCDLLCLTKGRVGFENKVGKVMATRQGQCFFYKGKNIPGFKRVFSKFGKILEVTK